MKKKSPGTPISRSNFLKQSAKTAGWMILPRFVLGGKGYIPPSDKLYIAAIGCGGEGENDIKHLATTPNKNSVIAFLCDVDERPAAARRKEFSKAGFYKDWRVLFEKEHKNFDAVTVAIPDHNHAVVGMAAMQLRKHLYLQKPLTHDIYEARKITEAAAHYQVVTQMGDQGASSDGMRTLQEWMDEKLIGEIEKIYCWTNRPVWPQGIAWPKTQSAIPKELDWNLWLGTAPNTPYVSNLVPFNWRGWWRFGTGALGDMGCHIMGPPFKLLKLGYPTEVSGSASTLYTGVFQEAAFPESGPVSSSLLFKFNQANGKPLDLIWMDGGIVPERLSEIAPGLNMNEALGDWPGENDFEGATLFIGTKGMVSCGWGGNHPRVITPALKEKALQIPAKYPRVVGGSDGHWWQWIDGCISGYKNAQLSSPFEGYAGPLTETVLLGNLLLQSFQLQEKITRGTSVETSFPHRYKSLLWDGTNMRVTNLDAANQFVKRTYRDGWGSL